MTSGSRRDYLDTLHSGREFLAAYARAGDADDATTIAEYFAGRLPERPSTDDDTDTLTTLTFALANCATWLLTQLVRESEVEATEWLRRLGDEIDDIGFDLDLTTIDCDNQTFDIGMFDIANFENDGDEPDHAR